MKFTCCKTVSESTTGYIVCTKCRLNFHISCLFPSDMKKVISVEYRNTWICVECLAKKPRVLKSDNTPIRDCSNSQQSVVSPDNITIRRGGGTSAVVLQGEPQQFSIDLLETVLDAKIAKLQQHMETVIKDTIASELGAIKSEISTLKETVSFLSTRFDDVIKRIRTLENDSKIITSTTASLGELKQRIDSLECENNNREQWARRSNIEIYGIPEKKTENLVHLVQDIADRTGFQMDVSRDIDFVTRVAPRMNSSGDKRIKPIVLRFLARYKKDDFLTHLKKLKLKACDFGFSGNNNNIYFNDHLTSVNKGVLQRAKVLAKERNFAFVWVKNCSIMVRRSDTSPVIHISNTKDLNKIK
ncbi:uncharacterized protein LOC113520150 [Galleria mellonella]|uniref:Uncharacterized protein LOC113520150 n=1 Tax=Galleria mellonella TaxID=7137 RepID=A0A6J1WY24_GALME|nr:uncharacterized protein LOC113520150 [Galleria mellonella]